MNRIGRYAVFCLGAVMMLLAGCGGGQGTSQDAGAGDRVATRVAEDLAVAATLTALAPRSAPAAADSPTPERLIAAAETPTPQTQPEAHAELTATPTPTRVIPTVVPVFTPTRVQVVVVPIDGGDNNNLHNGRAVKGGRNLLLPGFTGPSTNPVTFRDRIVFQVEVFDSTVGQYDGAGIQDVQFFISDGFGEVHSRTERTAGYCVFGGGEPDCTVWRFSEHNNRWPDGAELHKGQHNAQIVITAKSGESAIWNWTFVIE